MKADLYSKTRWFIYGFIAITIVVFFLFFAVGEPLVLVLESEGTGEVTELPYPKFMELSLYLCYAMAFIVALFALISFLMELGKKFAYDKKSRVKIILSIVLVVAIVLGFYLASEKIDYLIYLQYALLGIAALSMLSSSLISKFFSKLRS